MANTLESNNPFGLPIDPLLETQIKKRGEIFAKDGKTDLEQLYCHANAPWICLRSGVTIMPSSTGTEEERKLRSSLGINYTGTSKPFVLWGGMRNGTETGGVRSGIEELGASRDFAAYKLDQTGGRGFRPMPGITDISIKTLNTYGTIREAEVKIKVWSLDDLDLLNLYYFKLGFTALLEWGHSIWVDNKGTIQTNPRLVSDDDWFRNPPVGGLGPIVSIVNKIRKESCGNYDGLVGYITNFSYSLQKNGGYDCTVKILSAGSTIFGESLPTIGTAKTNTEEQGNKEDKVKDGPLGVILSTLSKASFYKDGKLKENYNSTVTYVGQSDLLPGKDILQSRPYETFPRYGTSGGYVDKSGRAKHLCFDGLVALGEAGVLESINTGRETKDKFNEHFKVSRLCSQREDLNYIKLRDFLMILGFLLNIKFDLRTPYRFVSFDGMVSLNPKIAILIRKGSCGNIGNVGTTLKVDDELFTGAAQNYKGVNITEGWNVIGNIWINVEYLASIVRELCKDSEHPTVDKLFSIILGDLDGALGRVTNLGLHRSDENESVAIIDRNLVGDPADPSRTTEKVILPSSGIRSTMSNINVNSDVTKEIASMFSIAAAAGADGKNKTDNAIATLVYLRGAARDLHIPNQDNGDKTSNSGSSSGPDEEREKEINAFKQGLEKAYKTVRGSILEESGEVKNLINIDISKIKFETWTEDLGTTGASLYNDETGRRFKLKNPGQGALQTGMIPVKVSFKMKGIGGFLIGTCFKLEPGLLLHAYDDWGYIITGVSHSVSNKGWETDVQTQYYPVVKN